MYWTGGERGDKFICYNYLQKALSKVVSHLNPKRFLLKDS